MGHFRFNQIEGFAQDSWRVTQKLSLELGLRYQWIQPFYLQGNNGSNFDSAVYNPTNAVTVTAAPGAAGAPYTMFSAGLPTSNPGYTAAWTGSAECNNTYDPATKTFKLRYGYLGGTGWRVTEEILTRK